MGAVAADGGCDEASVVFLVSKDPGSGGRCLNDSQQLHLTQKDILNQNLPRQKPAMIPLQGPVSKNPICNPPHCYCVRYWAGVLAH